MTTRLPGRLVAGLVQWAAAAVLAAYALHLLGVGGRADGFDSWAYNGLIGVSALLCLARGITVREEGTAWLFLGGGLLCWFAGEVYFTLWMADLYPTPVPSVSDGLLLAFYPASYVALVLMVRARVRRFQASMWLDGLIGAMTIGAAATAVFMEPILQSTGRDTAEIVTSLAYPVGDTLLVAMVVGVFAITGWRPGRDWLLVGAGLAAMAVADVLFLYLSANDTYREGTLLDALWPASSLLLAYAAWARPGRPRARDMLKSSVMLFAPGAFAAAAVALMVLGSVSTTNTTSLVLATAALGIVIVRLGMTLGENVRLLSEIRHESVTDPLTCLGNRRKLIGDLEEMLSHPATAAKARTIALFDLDGFKDYNDTYGHPAGDALLATLGQKLAAAVHPDGQAYRLGGDEFCVVLDGVAPMESVERIRQEGLTQHGSGFSIGASCGRVVLPEEADTVSTALRVADTRLYRDKGSSGRASALQQARDVLLQALSERSPGLDRHLDDVARLAAAVGTRLSLSEGELLELACAAQLHDVGKIAIPEALLEKPGPLDEAEWRLMRSHTLIGDRIIRAAPMLSGVAKLVRHSHERWDGDGYPAGLAGEAIPLASRIIFACHAFDAMTSERAYKRAVAPAEALAELRRGSGTQFDQRVVSALCAAVEADQRSGGQEYDPLPAALTLTPLEAIGAHHSAG